MLPSMTVPATVRTNVREKSLRSVLWVTALQALVGGLYFTIPLALSYVLSPSELGLMELALSLFGLALLCVELGTGPAVVQKPEVDAAYLSSVFWVNLALGGLWACALVLSGPFLTQALQADARLSLLLAGVAASLLAAAFGFVPRALLVRRMEFRRITWATAVSIVAALVFGGYGFTRDRVFGLVWGLIAFTFSGSVAMSLAARYRPRLLIDKSHVGAFLRFGTSASAATAGDQMAQQMERFLIGGFLGTSSLGVWVLARSLIREPLRRLMSVFDEILLPGLAAVQHDKERCRAYYLRVVRYELAVFGPAVVFIAVFAAELSRLFYGPTWETAVPVVVQLVAFHTWRTISGHSIGAIFLSQGRPDTRLRWVTVNLALVPLQFFVGSSWGLPGYALSLSLVGIVGWVISRQMANRLIDLTWRRFLAALAAPFAAQVFLTLMLVPARWLAAPALTAHPRAALFFVPGAAAVYLGLLALVDRPLLVGLTRDIRAVLAPLARVKAA